MQADDQVTSSLDSTTGNDNRFNLRMNQIGVSGGSGLATTMQVDYFSSLLDAQANAAPKVVHAVLRGELFDGRVGGWELSLRDERHAQRSALPAGA